MITADLPLVNNQAWSDRPASLKLAPGAVHVWRAPLSGEGIDFAGIERCFSAEERLRAQNFVRADARRQFSITRWTLRSLLGEYLQIPPSEVQIERSARGKPRLGATHADSIVNFNVSHSGLWALLAFRSGGAVGIDLECIRSSVQWLPLAARYLELPARRLDRLASLPEQEGRREFFQLWTCREAVLKGLGYGIEGLGPGNCMLASKNETSDFGADPRFTTEPAGWSVAELPLWPGYVGAVAAVGGFSTIEQWDFLGGDDAVTGKS